MILILFLKTHAKRQMMQLHLLSTRNHVRIAIMDFTGRIAFPHSITKTDMCRLFQKALKQNNGLRAVSVFAAITVLVRET